jgi:hypothetical protein
MPSRCAGLFDREERYDRLANDLPALQAYVAGRMA